MAEMLAFVHIEKTAGITFNQILRNSFGMRHCDIQPWSPNASCVTASDVDRLRRIYPSLESIAGHQVVPWSDLHEWFPGIQYHTILREPLARCASHYQFQIQKMRKSISFDDWVKNEKYHNVQCRKLCGHPSASKAIEILEGRVFHVGLLESFDESMVMLKKAVDWKEINIFYRRQNVALDSKLKADLLSQPKSHAVLAEMNTEDQVLYDYVRNTVYRLQKEKYGDGIEGDTEKFRQQNAMYSSVFEINRKMNLLKRTLHYKPVLRLYRMKK